MNDSLNLDSNSVEYTHTAVRRQVLADLDTPVSAYLKLAQHNGGFANTFLLESVIGGERFGRYSIIGLACAESISVRGLQLKHQKGDEILFDEAVDDPLDWIEQYVQQRHVEPHPDLPPMSGGLVGYFGHETIAYIEPRLNKMLAERAQPDELNLPDVHLLVADEVVVFDNAHGVLNLIVIAERSSTQALHEAEQRLDEIQAQLADGRAVAKPTTQTLTADDFTSGFGQSDYEAAVAKVKQYIVDGDAMQVVISQRMSADFSASSIDLYRALRMLNPSPYLFHMDMGDFQIVGSSPEILVKAQDGEMTVRPIAGTRPRGATEAEDKRLELELLADPKERAEHLMLIDLGRNDVGRVCSTGSVKLTDQMSIERYSHVMHIVSNVRGQLQPGLTIMDALRAAFPAGTLSGAPKIRALEIIAELEPVKRGVYGGAVGYISWAGNLDTAIAIRTAVIHAGKIHVQAGAGLVADSVPENEWTETLNKARAVVRAAELASAGL